MTTEADLRSEIDRLRGAYDALLKERDGWSRLAHARAQAYDALLKERDAWSRLARARGEILVHGPTPTSADRAQRAADALEHLGVNSNTGRPLRSKSRAAAIARRGA